MNNQDHSQNSVNSSRLCQKSKSNLDSKRSDRKNTVIAKYFTKASSSNDILQGQIVIDKEDNNEVCSDQNNSLSNDISVTENNSSTISDKDFKTPKRVKKISKLSSTQSFITAGKSKSRITRSQKSKRNTTTQIIPDSFQNCDVNPEHLQLALALSKSVESEQREDQSVSIGSFTKTKKPTLEHFGFKSHRSANNTEGRVRNFEVQKKRKKSKFKYITPVLFLRTQEQREQIISEKIALILNSSLDGSYNICKPETVTSTKPVSRNLEKLHSQDNAIFKVNSLDKNSLNDGVFYKPTLNLTPSKAKCGILLKNWSDIPGRETSPLKSIHSESAESEINEKSSNKINFCSKENDLKVEVSQLGLKTENVFMEVDQSNAEAPANNVIVENKLCKNQVEKNTNSFSVLENSVPTNSTKISDPIRSTINRSVSPDLFDSDDDSCSYLKSYVTASKSLYDSSNCNSQVLSMSQVSQKQTSLSSVENVLATSSCCAENRMSSLTVFAELSEDKPNKNHDNFMSSLNKVQPNLDREIKSDNVDRAQSPEDKKHENCGSATTEFRNKKIPLEYYDLTESPEHENSQSCDGDVSLLKLTPKFESKKKLSAFFDLTQSPEDSDSEDHGLGASPLKLSPKIDSKRKLSDCFGVLQSPENRNSENCDVNVSLLKISPKIESMKRLSDYFDRDKPLKDEANKNKAVDLSLLYELQSKYEAKKRLSDYFDVGQSSNNKMSSFKKNSSPRKVDDNAPVTVSPSTDVPLDVSVNTSKRASVLSNSLNITDYINNMLGENSDKCGDNRLSIKKSCSQRDTTSKKSNSGSFPSQEFIQDNKKKFKFKKTSYSQSNIDINKKGAEMFDLDTKKLSFDDLTIIKEPSRTWSPKKIQNQDATSNVNKFKKSDTSATSDDTALSQESINISDEGLYYSSNFKTPSKGKDSSTASDDIVTYNLSSDSDDNETTNQDSLATNMLKNELAVDDKLLNSSPKSVSRAGPCNSELIFNNSHSIPQHDFPVLHRHVTTLNTKKKSALKKNYSFNDSLDEYIQHFQDPSPPTTFTSEPKPLTDNRESTTTPDRGVIIKTTDVTPMANYDGMNTPAIKRQLQQFGLKPLKRQRGVQILKHIYESTHPLMQPNISNDTESDDENGRVVKRRKTSATPRRNKRNIKNVKLAELATDGQSTKSIGTDEVATTSKNIEPNATSDCIEIVGDLLAQNESDEDLIFEKKKPSKKIASCQVPLHIAWHNFISSNPEMRKNMLFYEPLQLETLFSMLKEQGYQYNIQDLLTFLDKKCITVRMAGHQNNKKRRNKKKECSENT